MNVQEWISIGCLGIAVLVSWLSCLAIVLMKDTYERLNYSSAITAVSVPLVALAIWFRTSDPQIRIKILLITVILFFTNAVLTHATAKAHRIRSSMEAQKSK
ncbi:MAG: cation:proton antiporter [Bdellovibrionia bacterium]